jgi:hypothetical protein
MEETACAESCALGRVGRKARPGRSPQASPKEVSQLGGGRGAIVGAAETFPCTTATTRPRTSPTTGRSSTLDPSRTSDSTTHRPTTILRRQNPSPTPLPTSPPLPTTPIPPSTTTPIPTTPPRLPTTFPRPPTIPSPNPTIPPQTATAIHQTAPTKLSRNHGSREPASPRRRRQTSQTR